MRDYAQAAEGLGFDYLVGARPRARRRSRRRSRRASAAPTPPPITIPSCCSPSWPASRKKIGFAAGVLILAQRQAALVAKQAASSTPVRGPLPAGRRRRLERDRVPGPRHGLPHPRQALRAEQVRFMQALWAKAARQIQGRVPRADDGGINPRPKSGKRAGVVRRPCRGDAAGAWPSTATASCRNRWPAGRRGAQGLRQAARHDPRRRPQARASRPGSLGVARQGQRRTTGASEVAFWKKAGVHPRAAPTRPSSARSTSASTARRYDEHLNAITQYREAVKDLL